MSLLSRRRRTFISVFVVCWSLVFHYESARHFYLNPLVGHVLPKVKLLFPPAGWIMFFNVDTASGRAEVFGMQGDQLELIDPHRIITTRDVLFDNVRRNILISAVNQQHGRAFCRYLHVKFPEYENFLITYLEFPDVTSQPMEQRQHVMYRCNP